MTKTTGAIYEKGVLKLSEPLALPDKTRVLVTIETEYAVAEDAERALWLKASEQALTTAWDNSGDDIFNELLKG